MATEMRMCKGHGSEVLQCSGRQLQTNFYKSKSKFYDGYVPFCKTCMIKMFKEYIKDGATMQGALYYTLQKADIPLILEVYERLNEEAKTKNMSEDKYIGRYMTMINFKNCKGWNDFSDTDVDLNDIETRLQNREIKQKEFDDLELRWGAQEEEKDYEFLQDTFKRYTQDIEFESSVEEDMYVRMCLDILAMRNIREGRKSATEENYDSIDKRVGRAMKDLKINDFDSNKAKTPSHMALFEKITLVDENNVKDIYSEPTLDFDLNKIKEYNTQFSLRPLLNELVGHRDFDININNVKNYSLETDEW